MGKRKHKKKQTKNFIIGAGALAGATMAAVMLNSKNQTKKKRMSRQIKKGKKSKGSKKINRKVDVNQQRDKYILLVED